MEGFLRTKYDPEEVKKNIEEFEFKYPIKQKEGGKWYVEPAKGLVYEFNSMERALIFSLLLEIRELLKNRTNGS